MSLKLTEKQTGQQYTFNFNNDRLAWTSDHIMFVDNNEPGALYPLILKSASTYYTLELMEKDERVTYKGLVTEYSESYADKVNIVSYTIQLVN